MLSKRAELQDYVKQNKTEAIIKQNAELKTQVSELTAKNSELEEQGKKYQTAAITKKNAELQG